MHQPGDFIVAALRPFLSQRRWGEERQGQQQWQPEAVVAHGMA
ncbi:hypothetical protein SynMINOS11_01784 [Synechococcus sp. Minos11]|nr:hypothetical protein SynMINOS11_01784 [Synechococcus sp. Minos11]